MSAACRQAREAAQMRIVNGQGRTILYDTITLRKSALDFRQTDYLLKCIEDFGHHANTACLHLIDKLYEVALPSSFAHAHLLPLCQRAAVGAGAGRRARAGALV